MTPTQLRAFTAVARLGSVKAAAADLEVSEAAISLHVGQLRKELGDKLFVRTAEGLAFTPGGLRLVSRAIELLGLQGQTVLEVRQAGRGRRLLRLATSSLFAEYAAPGLIGLFTDRARDLDVELSLHKASEFASLLETRSVDAVIGPHAAAPSTGVATTHFLNYRLTTVAAPTHPFAASARANPHALREQTWLLGPSRAENSGTVSAMLRQIGVPPDQQQIFQSHAAAVEEAKRGHGVSIALNFAVARDLTAGHLVALEGTLLRAKGAWALSTLPAVHAPEAAVELGRFITTPRATQAMLRGPGTEFGRFKPAVHVTLWS